MWINQQTVNHNYDSPSAGFCSRLGMLYVAEISHINKINDCNEWHLLKPKCLERSSFPRRRESRKCEIYTIWIPGLHFVPPGMTEVLA